MKKLIYLIVTIAILGFIFSGCIPVVPPAGQSVSDDKGKPTKCTTIQDGILLNSNGEVITTGYDDWGYNYQAHMFNGFYWNNLRPATPWTKETLEAAGKSTTWLVMKWSDTWLSNKDCDGDSKLDRGYACNPNNPISSACEGSWVTNHQSGEYVNDDGKTCKWTYFVKIVYPPGGPVDADNDGHDDNTGGSIIWGSYVRIQQISNNPCAGEVGKLFAVEPTGFGAYK